MTMTVALPLLIVEPNRDMNTLLQRFFARQQVEVQVVTSVAAATAYLAQRPARVVLTDLFLPHGDGLALVQHIRHGAPHTHVVVMGAFSAPETQHHAIAAGADTFLDKPFTLARLWEVVQPAL
jgi:two-component system response regulator PilR (NtrC family)